MHPNFILIMADDQGWGDTRYNGNQEILTPNLDRMASEGIRFNRFYSAAPVCSPTRGSCLTGRHPYRYGIYFANTGSMRDGEITLPEVLKTLGYTTGHFGKWHLGTLTNDEIDANRGGRDTSNFSPPWDHGFDACFSTESKVPTWDPMVTPGKDAGGVGSRTPGEDYGTYYWTGPGQKASDNLDGDDSRIIMDRAIPFIRDAVKRGKPFLSVIWFHSPHLPVLTGKEYRDLYKDRSPDIQHYYGTITAMDEQIGRLLSELDELGIDENTVVFYTSDNGPEGREKTGRTQGSTGGLRGRKRSLYEGGIRVPGLMLWRGTLTGNREINVPAGTSDYYPTILDILDLQIPGQPVLDGISLMPVIRGKTEKRAKPIGFQSRDQLAWIDNHFKLYSPDQGASFELYNLEEDPGETNDVSAEYPEITKKMRKELSGWIRSCKKSNRGKDY
jgi:arylsulfatase A-like enzyme